MVDYFSYASSSLDNTDHYNNSYFTQKDRLPCARHRPLNTSCAKSADPQSRGSWVVWLFWLWETVMRNPSYFVDKRENEFWLDSFICCTWSHSWKSYFDTRLQVNVLFLTREQSLSGYNNRTTVNYGFRGHSLGLLLVARQITFMNAVLWLARLSIRNFICIIN